MLDEDLGPNDIDEGLSSEDLWWHNKLKEIIKEIEGEG